MAGTSSFITLRPIPQYQEYQRETVDRDVNLILFAFTDSKLRKLFVNNVQEAPDIAQHVLAFVLASFMRGSQMVTFSTNCNL